MSALSCALSCQVRRVAGNVDSLNRPPRVGEGIYAGWDGICCPEHGYHVKIYQRFEDEKTMWDVGLAVWEPGSLRQLAATILAAADWLEHERARHPGFPG